MMRRTERGFSLIELMVVLAIVATLVGATTVLVEVANKNAAKQLTTRRLTAIGSALEQLKSNDNLGYYPPTRTEKLLGAGVKPEPVGTKVGKGNETNVGIETVYIALNLTGVQVNLSGADDDAVLENHDDDNVNELVGTLKVLSRFEYVDAWGNPFVYIHSSDYTNMKGVEQYVLLGQTQQKVKPLTQEKTGKFFRPNGFQLFSLGPDGVPDTGDELHFGM